MDEIKIVEELVKAQVAKPARACVNSEAGFVKDKIGKVAGAELAAKYWKWAICRPEDRAKLNTFGDLVTQLQLELDAIDAKFNMPKWGTYGT